jgi:hypothetical protein
MVAELPVSIAESSGLLMINNSFLSFNDSGGEPEIYVFDVFGKLTHVCRLENASNIDWEAITIDQNGVIYIGDFGNNNNKRKDLKIYRLHSADVLSKKTVSVEVIRFSFPDQKEFPPEKTQWYYDAEAFVAKGDSLFIYTKNRTKPFDGIVKIYGLSNLPGEQSLKPYPSLHLPPTSWLENSVTDACLYKEKLFLLTYRYVYVVDFHSLKIVDTIEFEGVSQKEGIYYKDGWIYITDESTLLGSAKLYKINYPL